MQSYTDQIPQFMCPICKNVGWVYLDVPQGDSRRGKAFPCKCSKMGWEERRLAAMMKFCGLPDNASDLTFENYQVKPGLEDAYQGAMQLISGQISFLTLIGPVNTGKTHLAIAVCQEFIKQNIPAKYAFTPLLLDHLRNTYDKDASMSFVDFFDRYCRVPLLVLDDIYKERVTEWGEEKLTSLINSRYMDRKATIFTSNKPLSAMADAIQSRLQRESWCKVVVLAGVSL